MAGCWDLPGLAMENAVSGRDPTSPRPGTDGEDVVIGTVLGFSRPGTVM